MTNDGLLHYKAGSKDFYFDRYCWNEDDVLQAVADSGLITGFTCDNYRMSLRENNDMAIETQTGRFVLLLKKVK